MRSPGAILLSDDGAARAAATKESIAVSGTLGVLRDAAVSNMISIRQEVDRLRNETNFRGNDKILESVCVEVERLKRLRLPNGDP